MNQQFLDSIQDPFHFLEVAGNWDNHRSLLLLALNLTKGDVIELGSGDGSTPYLREFCREAKREFYSYDSNLDWSMRTKARFIEDWEKADIWKPCGLAFVDLAPGHYRVEAIRKLVGKADIICIHDSEEGGAGDYKLDLIWGLFKYRLDFNKNAGGAGCSLISNKIDLTKFKGLSIGRFVFDK